MKPKKMRFKKLELVIDDETYVPDMKVTTPSDCLHCAIMPYCTIAGPCELSGYRNWIKKPNPKVVTIEVDGKRYKLVPDANNDPFFGCKSCDLREQCRPSELLCDEIGRTDGHFELIEDYAY